MSAASSASPRGLEAASRGRVPPNDFEAERAVLSAVMIDNDALHAVYTEIKPDDFYHPAHARLYAAMIALREANAPVDLHTLGDYLTTHKELDDLGGAVFLAEVADYEATAANVVHHARIVRDKSVKRSLIRVATQIVELGYEQAGGADDLLDEAESRIFELSQAKGSVTFRSLHDEMQDTFDYVELLINRTGELTGVPTGYPDLDKLTGGLQPGDLVIIAARPSMGKTALALNVARNAAVEHGKKVAFFSLEMTTRQLVMRLLACEARFDFSAFHKGYVATHDLAHLTTAAGRLSQAAIYIDDSGALTVLEMKAKTRRLAAERGLDLVVVDYMQLMHGSRNRDSREQEISEISRGLKALAKELEIPVIALSQLNRSPENREDKRPRLADLRESGAIEQDADVIGFIYRDVVYHPDTDDERAAELIIQKHRNGPTDTLLLDFEGRYSSFQSRSGRGDGPGLPAAPGPPELLDAPDDEPPF